MGGYLASLRLNVSPETVDAQYAQLAGFMSAEARAEVAVILAEEAASLKGQRISQVFYGEKTWVSAKKLVVEIRGQLKRYVSSTLVETLAKKYELKFRLAQGQLYLTQFKEVKV